MGQKIKVTAMRNSYYVHFSSRFTLAPEFHYHQDLQNHPFRYKFHTAFPVLLPRPLQCTESTELVMLTSNCFKKYSVLVLLCSLSGSYMNENTASSFRFFLYKSLLKPIYNPSHLYKTQSHQATP